MPGSIPDILFFKILLQGLGKIDPGLIGQAN
jgi:hypothetical protein